jgi:hypothetical protein
MAKKTLRKANVEAFDSGSAPMEASGFFGMFPPSDVMSSEGHG